MKQLLAVFSILLSFSANADDIIKVGLVEFSPLAYTSATDGKCSGYAVDILTKIFSQKKLAAEFACTSPERIYRDMANATLDLTINIKNTPDLPELADFVDKPFHHLKLNLYRQTLTASDNMNKVAIIRGFKYAGMLNEIADKGVTLVELNSDIDAINVFLHKRTDHLLSYATPYQDYIDRLDDRQILGLGVVVDVTTLLETETVFAISKYSEHRRELQSIFAEVIAEYPDIEYLVELRDIL